MLEVGVLLRCKRRIWQFFPLRQSRLQGDKDAISAGTESFPVRREEEQVWDALVQKLCEVGRAHELEERF